MQSASANFAAAVSASSGVWATPQVRADWAGNGYDGDNTIDDLSPMAGRPIVINQALDDGMPSDVSLTSSGQDATAKVTMPVGGRTVAGVPLSGPQYWSVDNTTSPLSAYDRDVAALTVAHGLVTAGGIERVTVFTGQMSDAPVTSRGATVQGVSKTRLAMTKTVQPPPIVGDWLGLDGTWPVSWSLYQCGIYISPPPRSGCRLWMPMHGSIQPFLPAVGRKTIGTVINDLSGGGAQPRPTFVDGPYLAGVKATRNTTSALQVKWTNAPLASGTDLLTTVGNAGRLEMWVRGDATTAVGAPTELAALFIAPGDGASAWFGVDLNRKVFVQIGDRASHTATLTSTATLPTDGNWYFVGAAYDFTLKKLWVVNNFGGSNVVESSSASTIVASSLSGTENYNPDTGPGQVQVLGCIPMAEVHLTAGTQANPDSNVWINDNTYTWTAGAIVSRSQLPLFGLGEQKPRETWEFISSFAQAELATIRTDELDRFCYFPLSYWAQTAQQTVAETWSTRTNVGVNFTVTRDLTKIRNQVAVSYTEARLGQYLVARNDSVYVSFTQYTLPPGTTKLTLQFGSPVVRVEYLGDPFLLIDASYTAPPVRNFLAANTAPDGSGAYAVAGQVNATITSWDAGKAVLTIVNTTGNVLYTVHPTLAYINIAGTFLTQADSAAVTVQDNPSVSARGVRGLTVTLAAIQDRDTATRIAYELLARSLKARPQLQVTLHGDPRRQPGDLATFTDPGNTGLGGQWRSATVATTIGGASTTQEVVATKAWPVAVWDQTTWDNCIWGP